MSNPILKIENLSKQYRLGLVGTGTIADDLKRWWYVVRGKEDPFLKIGDVNDRATKGTSDYVWAIRDINFEVQPGEVLGIIGKNGAGKSTLLKILSKITNPTTGSIKSRGRIASLLEVGTGFHGEMTGRENIFLNGAILGMTKKEIASKLDEIVAFSGCERYIDTPVKRYSSGMTVRLAFAVAAFLEPDILIIDEVLAVGDAEFQKKAIGKMQDISKGDGRTVLFVSHNMAAVKSLCTRGIVLGNGGVVFDGDTDAAVDYYLNEKKIANSEDLNGVVKFKKGEVGNAEVHLLEITSYNSSNVCKGTFFDNEEIFVDIKIDVKKDIEKSRFAIIVKTVSEDIVFVSGSFKITNELITKGKYTLTTIIPKDLLNSIEYDIFISGAIPGKNYFFEQKKCLTLKIIDSESKGFGFNEKWPGVIHPNLNWSIK
ncbi:ABC transporter ATP-binding protein [Polaribacter sp. L3A8]|uniref:ABC transporter ATP-binding protein n=1 Tax=Polaribacter sp. L3A8 TaxID=2686361 RepID=UPI00131CD07C|nr:ABC transporter ATP-binding protein [Polaribacter sp. L3A8]